MSQCQSLHQSYEDLLDGGSGCLLLRVLPAETRGYTIFSHSWKESGVRNKVRYHSWFAITVGYHVAASVKRFLRWQGEPYGMRLVFIVAARVFVLAYEYIKCSWTLTEIWSPIFVFLPSIYYSFFKILSYIILCSYISTNYKVSFIHITGINYENLEHSFWRELLLSRSCVNLGAMNLSAAVASFTRPLT